MNINRLYKIKSYLICTFLCAISLTSRANHKADSLFDAGAFFHASIEYERLLFSTSSRSDANYYTYQKARCYKQIHEFDRAITTLQSIYFGGATDSLYTMVSYQLALCHYLNDDPVKALWKIDEYLNRTMDSTNYLRFLPVKVLCLNETGEWVQAKADLLRFLQSNFEGENTPNEVLVEVDQLYAKKSIPKLVDVKKAQLLSKFMPGVGQIYAGKTGEGITSLLLNASLFAFSIHQFYFKFYLTGYLAGLGVLNKTYQSGAARAAELSRETNEQRITHFNRKTTLLIQEVFK